jgi:hypothetical protein
MSKQTQTPEFLEGRAAGEVYAQSGAGNLPTKPGEFSDGFFEGFAHWAILDEMTAPTITSTAGSDRPQMIRASALEAADNSVNNFVKQAPHDGGYIPGPGVTLFASLIDQQQPQAAASVFGRLVAYASAGLANPPDKLGEMLLETSQTHLATMWQAAAVFTASDADANAELDLMRQVMLASLAEHASRSPRHRNYFETVADRLIGNPVLTPLAEDWALCR